MKLLIAALLTVFSTGAMAEWTYLTSSSDGNIDFYVDVTAIRKKGNVAKMWLIYDYKSPQKEADGKSYSSQKVFSEYDCVEIRSRTLSITAFSGNIGRGTVVLTEQYDNSKWRDIVPDSVGTTEWEVACKK